MIWIAEKGHFRTQIPHPMHRVSEMNAIFDSGATSIQSLPVLTTGQDFLHSCLHFFGLHLSVSTIAILPLSQRQVVKPLRCDDSPSQTTAGLFLLLCHHAKLPLPSDAGILMVSQKIETEQTALTLGQTTSMLEGGATVGAGVVCRQQQLFPEWPRASSSVEYVDSDSPAGRTDERPSNRPIELEPELSCR